VEKRREGKSIKVIPLDQQLKNGAEEGVISNEMFYYVGQQDPSPNEAKNKSPLNRRKRGSKHIRALGGRVVRERILRVHPVERLLPFPKKRKNQEGGLGGEGGGN